MPDSIKSCGELKVPPARMTSRRAVTLREVPADMGTLTFDRVLAVGGLEAEAEPKIGLPLLAGAVVVVVPVIAVFLLLQRHFVQGIATTGIK